MTDRELRRLVDEVNALFGDAAFLAARARAYDTARGMPNGPEWVRVFQNAFKAELRHVLQRH